MKLKELRPLLALVAVGALVAQTSDAASMFTGGNDLFDDNAYSPVTTVDESNQSTNNPVAADLLYQNVNIAGGGYATNFGELRIGAGQSATFDNSSLDTSGGNGGIGAADAGSEWNLTNGSFLNLQFVSGGQYNIDGTSHLQLRGGGDPINSINQAPASINLAPGGMLTLASVAEFTEQGEEIFLNGVSFASNPSILVFDGNKGTAIPEPSTMLLCVLGGIASLSVLRKR